MKKKRISSLILFFLIALFVFSFFTDKLKRVHGDTLVGTPTVSWNNVDYSYTLNKDWAPNKTENGIPLEGYVLLPTYPTSISTDTYIDTNLLELNLPGCNVGDHILINGEEAKNVSGVVIYCFPQNGFFIYIPHSSISFSDEFEYVTVEVLEGMSIDGVYKTVYTRFEYRGILGSFNNWLVDPLPVEKKKSEFVKFDWNNIDHSYTVKSKWCGDLLANGSPKDGYCVLAFFKEEGKTMEETRIGDLCNTGRGVIGLGLSADYKIKVNGINIVDVKDAKCYIFPYYGLFFYIPDASITYTDEYKCPTITIESGLRFNEVVLPSIIFEFRGALGQPGCWSYIKDESEYNKPVFTGVAPGWNNTQADAKHNHTILSFGTHGVDYLSNTKQADPSNLVNRFSDAGLKISVNGVPFSDIDDILVSYAHGFNYLYIALPSSILIPSHGYRVVTLKIENKTIIYDAMLPEVTLYLFNGEWTEKRPDVPLDEEYNNSLTLNDLYDSDTLSLDNKNKQMLAENVPFSDMLGIYFDYKLVSENSSFSILTLGDINNFGLRIEFINNVINVYDLIGGNVLIDTATITTLSFDEWYSLLVIIKREENAISISLSIDDITYIHIRDIVLNYGNELYTNVALYLTNGNASFKTATLNSDNKKPVLTYNGKMTYNVFSGDEIIDFSDKCIALDKKDGDVTSLIEYIWPEGSITNNKINRGVWSVLIVSKDKSGNESLVTVEVIAKALGEFVVTFDGLNASIYKAQDHIKRISDPVKEDPNKTYRFIGWYNGDVLWDFENDTVNSDLNLVSRFQETVLEYPITFIPEGLKNNELFILYFVGGANIDLSIFEKDGYTLKAYLEDAEIKELEVSKDETIKLVYTSLKQDEPLKKGCRNSICTPLIFIVAPCILSISLFKNKKEEKENE